MGLARTDKIGRIYERLEDQMEGTVDTMPKLERSASWPLDHRSERGEATSELKRWKSLPLELLRTLLRYLARKVSTAGARSKDNSTSKDDTTVDTTLPVTFLRIFAQAA